MTEISKYKKISALNMTGKKVVYQGTEGAYSQAAMFKFFGKDVDCFNVGSFRKACEALKNDDAEYAVMPLENSTAGIVAENYDHLTEYGFYIVGEQMLRISHCVLGIKGCEFSKIQRIYSHPQALAQCSKFFEENRQIEAIPVSNTAVAAEKIMKENDPAQAAIAGIQTASIYDLNVLKEAVQNNLMNETRFIIVGKEPVFVEGADKISIGVQLKNKPGALYHALAYFYNNGVNMTSIESRPIPECNWEYRFYIDLEGSLEDDAVKTTLAGLKDETQILEIYGNYCRSVCE